MSLCRCAADVTVSRGQQGDTREADEQRSCPSYPRCVASRSCPSSRVDAPTHRHVPITIGHLTFLSPHSTHLFVSKHLSPSSLHVPTESLSQWSRSHHVRPHQGQRGQASRWSVTAEPRHHRPRPRILSLPHARADPCSRVDLTPEPCGPPSTYPLSQVVRLGRRCCRSGALVRPVAQRRCLADR